MQNDPLHDVFGNAPTGTNVAQVMQQNNPIPSPVYNYQPQQQQMVALAFRPDLLDELVNSNCVATKEGLLAVFTTIMQFIPKSSAYTDSEVKIHKISDVAADGQDYQTIANLLGAGTLVLDAVLYMAYGSTPAWKNVFSIEGSRAADKVAGNHWIKAGFALLTAAIEFYFTRGQLPNRAMMKAPLSNNMIKRTLNGLNITEEGPLAYHLSCTTLGKFPMSSLCDIGYKSLDKTTVARIQLSPAGGKFKRYFVIARPMLKSPMTQIETNFYNFVLGIPQQDLMAFHPEMSSVAPKPPKFTDKMIRIALSLVDPTKAVELYDYMLNQKMTSLLLKESLIKRETENGRTHRVMFPCMTDPELSPHGITIETVTAIISQAKTAFPALF